MTPPRSTPAEPDRTPSGSVRLAEPRIRVISDNDYAGDPDGLFQLAHLALSTSVDLRAVIASHLAPGDPFDSSGHSAEHGVRAARELLDLIGASDVPVVAGAETGLPGPDAVVKPPTSDTRRSAANGSDAYQAEPGRPLRPSPAAQFIVDEAMRTDTELPLFVTFGGGLTELAAAYQHEPRIVDRLTAVWIGGPEYGLEFREHGKLGQLPPPGAPEVEYNLNIDLRAAQLVFDSDLPLWQVPRNTYRQALVSRAEIDQRVRCCGRLGQHLATNLDMVSSLAGAAGHNLGETYVLGDNPLVLLTALLSAFEPDASSSCYTDIPRPRIGDRGTYEPRRDAPAVRVFTQLDTRLMVEDLFAKLAVHAGRAVSRTPVQQAFSQSARSTT